VDSEKWYVEAPIRLQRYYGFVWTTVINQLTVEKLLELLFAEVDWFSVTTWTESPDPFENILNSGPY